LANGIQHSVGGRIISCAFLKKDSVIWPSKIIDSADNGQDLQSDEEDLAIDITTNDNS